MTGVAFRRELHHWRKETNDFKLTPTTTSTEVAAADAMPSSLLKTFKRARVYAFLKGVRPMYEDLVHSGKGMIKVRLHHMTPHTKVDEYYARMMGELRDPKTWGHVAFGVSSSRTGNIQIWLASSKPEDVFYAVEQVCSWSTSVVPDLFDDHHIDISFDLHEYVTTTCSHATGSIEAYLANVMEARAIVRAIRAEGRMLGFHYAKWNEIDRGIACVIDAYTIYAHQRGIVVNKTSCASIDKDVSDRCNGRHNAINAIVRKALTTVHDAMRRAYDDGFMTDDGMRCGFEMHMADLLHAVGQWAFDAISLNNSMKCRGISTPTLDVHDFDKVQCAQAVRQFLDRATQTDDCAVAIITGRGKHSANGKAVLKSLVYRILSTEYAQLEARDADGNPGMIAITFRKQLT